MEKTLEKHQFNFNDETASGDDNFLCTLCSCVHSLCRVKVEPRQEHKKKY